MKTIGVIGAGTMGIGVAISLLQKKISVRLIDIDKDQIGRAKTEIENKIAIYSMLRGIDIDEEATKKQHIVFHRYPNTEVRRYYH